LAEFESHIEARFITQDTNLAGIYLVNFFVNGIFTPVVIDDYLPTKNNNLVFAKSKGFGEIWVCLLEKAWAKLYGSYCRMSGGDPSFACIHLNGTPAETHYHEEIRDKGTAD